MRTRFSPSDSGGGPAAGGGVHAATTAETSSAWGRKRRGRLISCPWERDGRAPRRAGCTAPGRLARKRRAHRWRQSLIGTRRAFTPETKSLRFPPLLSTFPRVAVPFVHFTGGH